jgi:hypothetical protein
MRKPRMATQSLPYGITAEQRYLIARLRWLCQELIAGNQFEPRTLRGWSDRAQRELDRHSVEVEL